ncbi:MAG: tetratricopeptide repeat protein [Planctomycetota bacterium]|nr:tetratricopeptide repeat protein [Planctomycetota bacterium]
MCGKQHRQELLAVSVMLMVLGGCQQLSSPLSRINPFNRTAAADKTGSAANPSTSDTVTPDQKANVQIAMARGLENQGRTDEAKKLYLQIIKLTPRRADAYHYLALLHDRKGECPLAQDYYRLALERDPENPELHCDRGYNAYLQQRWEDAEKSLRQAIALAPDLARAHNNLGMLLARTGRDSEALQEFAKAGANEGEARANLALAMSLSNRWTEAQAQYQAALTVAPNLRAAQDGARILQTVASQRAGSQNTGSTPPFTGGITQAAYLAPQPAPGR